MIYHNPRCSKSRQTLALLREHDIDPVIVNYLENPPTKTQLRKLCKLLGKGPVEIMRFKERIAKEKNLAANDQRTDSQWFELIIQDPILLERPIVVVDDKKAALGRPPENVLAII